MSDTRSRNASARLPPTAELLSVASRVIWFEPPENSLRDTNRFLAYLMTYGTVEDVAAVLAHLSLDDFHNCLESPPPGIFDRRSWAYWNLVAGRDPAAPLPVREVPAGALDKLLRRQ